MRTVGPLAGVIAASTVYFVGASAAARFSPSQLAFILIGAALLQVLQNLVNLLGIPSSLNFAVMGAVILIGVIADQLLKRRSALA